MSGMRMMAGLAVVTSSALAISAGIGTASATASTRPAAEHVPSAIQNARIADTSTYGSPGSPDKVVALHGAKAQELVRLFDALKLEPADTVHCMIAGGPQTTVTFHGTNHTWVATQGACTNIVVTRDGKSLPTLLPSKQWTATINRDLGK